MTKIEWMKIVFWWLNFPRGAGRHAMGEISQFCNVGLQATCSHRPDNVPSIWLCGHWSPLRDIWGVGKLRGGSSPLAKRWREDYTEHNPRERKDVEGDVEGRGSGIPTLNPTLSVPICILHKLCIHQLLNPQPWDSNAITSLMCLHSFYRIYIPVLHSFGTTMARRYDLHFVSSQSTL